MTRTPPSYFERLYAADADPWGFATSWYERRKYAVTMAALPDERYRAAFEPGCSVGVLTEALAGRCDRVLAADHTGAVVDTARRRLAHLPQVTVEQRTVPEEWPPGPFDLLVLSEVGYYFDASELDGLMQRAIGSLDAGATVVGVHWRGETDYPLGAAETHRRIGASLGSAPIVHHEDPAFLLDVWRTLRTLGANPQAGPSYLR